MDGDSNNTAVRMTLEGNYTPSGYFEEPVRFDEEEYATEISGGKVVVTISRDHPLPSPEERVAISKQVERIFVARQFLTGKTFELSELSVQRYHPDGRTDVWVSLREVVSCVQVFSPDIVVKDINGNVLHDSKAFRLAQDKHFLDRCLKHAGDEVLDCLLASFGRAVDDAAGLLHHLYEIRDALRRHFGGDAEARRRLGISNRQWSDFGQLANDKPIEESRHRGLHPVRRPATEGERNQAIEFARMMIQRYLDHLDGHVT